MAHCTILGMSTLRSKLVFIQWGLPHRIQWGLPQANGRRIAALDTMPDSLSCGLNVCGTRDVHNGTFQEPLRFSLLGPLANTFSGTTDFWKEKRVLPTFSSGSQAKGDLWRLIRDSEAQFDVLSHERSFFDVAAPMSLPVK